MIKIDKLANSFYDPIKYGDITVEEAQEFIYNVTAPDRNAYRAAVKYELKEAGSSKIPFFNLKPNPGGDLIPYTGNLPANQAWSTYKSTNEAISTVTKGAQAPNSLEVPGGTSLTRGIDGAIKPSSLLALELPTATAAIAPILGIGVGVSLYRENPQAWETISRALLPFCYDDGKKIPGFVEFAEAAGSIIANVLLPTAIVDALKGALTESNIIDSSGEIVLEQGYIKDGEFYPTAEPNTWISWPAPDYPNGGYMLPSNFYYSGGAIYNLSPAGSGVTALRYYSYPGGTAPSTRGVAPGDGFVPEPNTIDGHGVPGSSFTEEMTKTVDAIKNGIWSERYPAGINPWGETIYYPQPGPLPQVPSGIDSTTGNVTWQDAVPVPLPNPISPEQSLTDPFPYPSESSDPVPWPSPQPFDRIDPLRIPGERIKDLPWPETTADPWPQPDPDPYPQPRPDPEPENPTEPQPTGPDIDDPVPPPPSGGDTGPTPLGPDISPPWGSGADPDGLIAVYNPPVSTLREFAKWLWVTWPQAGLDKIWNNPFDGVISLFELYCTPPVIGSRNIRSGFLDSNITSPVIGRYTTINCGTLVIPEYWNNYLDYAPYSKASIYLPFIGIVNVDVNDIVGHAVNITYNIDCYNGSCIAMITVAKDGPDGSIYNCLAYQFSGNCAVDVPLSGGSQAAIKGAIINASAVGIGGLIMGAAQMNAGKMLSGAGDMIVAAEHALSNVMSARSSVQKSGSFGASFGAMGHKNPYIMIQRPIQVGVVNYNELYGYQAHKAVTIGQCRGYIRCREVHVESPTASDAEKNKIAQMLKDGVWI